jgi:hypothetical protein
MPETSEEQVKKLACIICGKNCLLPYDEKEATCDVMTRYARRVLKSDFLKEWAESHGYRKIDMESLTALPDYEIIKVTNSVCKKYGLVWGEFDVLKTELRPDDKTEAFIIEIYSAIQSAQLLHTKQELRQEYPGV